MDNVIAPHAHTRLDYGMWPNIAPIADFNAIFNDGERPDMYASPEYCPSCNISRSMNNVFHFSVFNILQRFQHLNNLIKCIIAQDIQ